MRNIIIVALLMASACLYSACGKKRVGGCNGFVIQHLGIDSIRVSGVHQNLYNPASVGDPYEAPLKEFQFSLHIVPVTLDTPSVLPGSCVSQVYKDTVVSMRLITVYDLDATHPAGSDVGPMFQTTENPNDFSKNLFVEFNDSYASLGVNHFGTIPQYRFTMLTRYGTIKPNTLFKANLIVTLSNGKVLYESFPEIKLL
jgi:hypothetical protein